MSKRGLMIVVSAPSGAGKSSICRKVLSACSSLTFSVSYTSRAPRPKEMDGNDYHFISRDDFENRIGRGEFVEWVENFGHYYGTSARTIEETLDRGADLLLDIEPRGAREMKKRFDDAIFVFVLPPSLEELLTRLEKRGHETPEVIQTRFAQAQSELQEIFWYDYTIINDRLSVAVEQLKAVYAAEQCRTSRLSGWIEKLMSSRG